MKIILAYIFLCLIFNSCSVLNLTGNDGKICQEHEKAMHKSFVRIHYGRTCPDRGNAPDYPNAKCMKCMGCIVSDPRYSYSVIWTCKTCTKLKRKDKRD